MNITSLLADYQKHSGEQLNNKNLIVAKALIFIVENHFLSLASSFVLTLSFQNGIEGNFFNKLLEELFQMWDAPPMQIVKMPQNGTFYVPGRRYCNLIFVDSFESFRAIDVISYTSNYNINEYYHIFLQNRDHLSHKEMILIFDYCWQHHIINCNVQLQTADGETLIYTYYPFIDQACGQVTSVLINRFNESAMTNEVLFPKKLLNFHGCTLRLATWNVPPYMYLEKFRNGSQQVMKKGIEARLVLELSRKMNFIIKVIEPANNVQRGLVEENGNLTGALSMLDNNEVEFSTGCFRLAFDRFLVTTATYSYYHTTQVICIPLAAYTFSSLEILFYPFTLTAWLSLVATWLISLAVVFLLKKYHREDSSHSSYLNVFLMALGFPPVSFPGHISARFLYVHWMVFTLVVRTAYQAALFHLIRTRVTNRLPRSVDELMISNYTMVMNNATYMAMLDVQFLKEMNLQLIGEIKETLAFEYVEKNAHKRSIAAAGPLDFLAHYGIENKKAGVFRLLPQQIISMPLTMYLRKHSYLIDQFNEELLRFCATGFIEIWARWELDYDYLRKRQATESKIFNLNELYMLFVFGLIGLFCSMLVFAFELMSKKYKVLENIFKKI